MFEEDSSKNVVIVDSKGEVIYFTENNLPVYDLDKKSILGANIGSVYRNLDENNSSLINSIKTGNTVVDLKQGLETNKNKRVHQVGTTYPLIENNKIIGAIEFSNIINMELLKRSRDRLFKIQNSDYRSNGTIYDLENIITRDESMKRLKSNIKRVSKTNSNIMIYGETGTGKELVAQSIHNQSERKDSPFISQNCGAIPENLIESILFGTTEGSFTGAQDKPGLFEMANGGTIFLDEINSLDKLAQVKLLKVIEERRVRRVGGIEEIPVDIRLVVATNKEPELLIDEDIMRKDLYYRLSVVQLKIPKLKDRKTDIEYLSNYFIEKFNEEFNMDIDYIDEELLNIFNNYNWPGNVRELKNVIESSFNLLDGNKIGIEDIPENILKYKKKPGKYNNFDEGLKEYLDKHEKEIILSVYKKNEQRLTETANYLNISKQLLRYKLDKYNI